MQILEREQIKEVYLLLRESRIETKNHSLYVVQKIARSITEDQFAEFLTEAKMPAILEQIEELRIA